MLVATVMTVTSAIVESGSRGIGRNPLILTVSVMGDNRYRC
ncbi:MAG: hypothetical protein U5L01_07765 [Rheinheimera sp.]|nr:hypothetical protein [Rheinheimera sp.]